MAPPVVTQQPAANIRYVDQFGNPVAPPQTGGAVVQNGYPGARAAGGQQVSSPEQVLKQRKSWYFTH